MECRVVPRDFTPDPAWQFTNRTGKVAPEHRRLARYATMTVDEICALPVPAIVAETAHQQDDVHGREIINGKPRESRSREVDHVTESPSGARIALEIERNDKDPFGLASSIITFG